MKGYGSHRRLKASELKLIHTTTSAVWTTRKRAVPSRRAIDSEKRPNASGS